jgi:predicted NUDIX family NTP pyrophosphohydrolase
MEWPPKSGQIKDFPEVDRIGWFAPDSAIEKIIKGQVPILGKLFVLLEDKK